MSYTHSWRGQGGYGTSASAESLKELAARGVTWISLTPFVYQDSTRSTHVRAVHDRAGGETDEAMARDIASARALGMRVMLKPHVWIRGGDWPGDVAFESDEDWASWFDSYAQAILEYARFAGRERVDSFCIGNELKAATAAQPGRWRELIASVRRDYSGPLTYAANWDEYSRVDFWGDLDAIGINAYFPLSESGEPTMEELCAGAARARDAIAALQARLDRPVIFTEVGFRSMKGAAARPWWHAQTAEPDLELQARCYEAIFRTFWDEPWMRGMFWWKWFSGASSGDGGADYDAFSPRGKPAEQVLRAWYARLRPLSRSPD